MSRGFVLALIITVTTGGCPSLRDRFASATRKDAPFDRGNALARSKDNARASTLDPADDVFLRGSRSRDSDEYALDRPERDSVLTEASAKSAGDNKGRVAVDEGVDGELIPKEASVEKYRAIRQRLEAINAVWSSERASDGSGFAVRCEVPHPKDPELAQVFESKSKNEVSALTATTVQAEKWLANLRQEVDPLEADLDPWTP